MPEKLSPESFDGPLRLLAGPGAGKTHALVELYAGLVESGRATRDQILVLTFSTSAAGELERRLDDRLRDSFGQSWISTFHSFCARLLREHGRDRGGVLLAGFQEWLVMRRVLEEMDPTLLGALAPVRRSDAFAQDLLAFVALLKQNLVHPGPFALLAETSGTPRLRELAAAYSAYQARLDGAGLSDFRDLVNDTYHLLDHPEVLARLQARYRYLLVDEFQDVDPAQFALLAKLAPPGGRPNLLVAGDPDQSIYGFRGTVPRLLTHDLPAAYRPDLVEIAGSRRCPPEVLEAAERLLAATQPARQGRAVTSERPSGLPVTVVREANAVDEAFFAAREIKRLVLEEGLRPQDCAILLRSTTTLSAPFEEAIRALGLPYEVRGVGALARNEVVRFLLAYLRALARPDDPEALERMLSSGLAGVDQRTVGRLRRYSIEEGRRFDRVVRQLLYKLEERDAERWPLPWRDEAAPPPAPDPESRLPQYAGPMSEAELDSIHRALTAFTGLRARASRLPLAALAYAVLMDAGVLERLLALELPEPDRREALEDLGAAVEAFRGLEEVQERLAGAPPLLAEVERLEALVARSLDDAQPAERRRDAVQILTVHQSKGLEFEAVFLAGFAQGVFPLAARPHPLLEEEDQRWLERELAGFRPSWPGEQSEHLAEEARLAYVGMTRARGRLYITYADEYDQPAGPSQFLAAALPGVEEVRLSRTAAAPEPSQLLTRSEAETLLAACAGDLDAAGAGALAELGVDLDFVRDPASGMPYRPYEGEGGTPEGVDPGHYSATALNSYLKCPRLYFYNEHPGLTKPPRGVELERGSFLHQVLEDFHRRESEWRDLEPEAQRGWLEEALKTHLEGYLGRVEGTLERKAEEQEVRRILDNYIKFATSSQPILRKGTLATEKKFTLFLDGAEIHGKIDRVNDTGGGTCEVVDYKTGRGRSANKAYSEYFGEQMSDVQLLLYNLACADGVDEEGKPIALTPRFLSLWYPKEQFYGQMRQVLFAVGEPALGVRDWLQKAVTPEDLQRGRELVSTAIRRIEAGDFRPQPRDTIGTCLSYFGCPHAAVCPFGGTPIE